MTFSSIELRDSLPPEIVVEAGAINSMASGEIMHVHRDWSKGQHSGLVDLGTYTLELKSIGPDRKLDQPVVIIVQGLGSSASSWATLQRLLAPSIRSYSYERIRTPNTTSEISTSDDTTEPDIVQVGTKPSQKAVSIALELDSLLMAARIPGPYVLVAHSWGGIIAREFLAVSPLRKHDVAGMVFVDSNQERTLKLLDWRKVFESPVLEGVRGGGLLDLDDQRKAGGVSDDEWSAVIAMEGSVEFRALTVAETSGYEGTYEVLGAKKQLEDGENGRGWFLGRAPVCVVKGDTGGEFRRMAKVGMSRGNGTSEERATLKEVLDRWFRVDEELQREILMLSEVGHFEEIKGSGHFLQLTTPGSVLEGVRWVFEHLEFKEASET